MTDAQRVTALLAQLRDPDPSVRAFAVRSLAPFMGHGLGVYEAILPLVTQDPDRSVRDAAWEVVE